MPVMTVFNPANESMEIWFGGNLDLTMTRDIRRTCDKITPRVRFCVLDLRGVVRVFDSGVGLMLMLCHHLKAVGAQILVLGDFPEVKRLVDAHFDLNDRENACAARQSLSLSEQRPGNATTPTSSVRSKSRVQGPRDEFAGARLFADTQ